MPIEDIAFGGNSFDAIISSLAFHYFEGDRTANFLGEKVIKYHKTLTTYLNGLIQGGFELTGIVEPQPPEYLLHTVKGMEDELRRPMMLIVSAKKK